MAKVVVAMSGGVDSSVAAHLLQRAGHEIVGLFMRHGEAAATSCTTEKPGTSPLFPILSTPSPAPSRKQGCCSVGDAADARRVADRLDVPFYAIDFSDDFGRIQDYFVDEYVAGRTPNPCVMCNTWLKFGKLLDYADDIGAEFVATGHYARTIRRPGEPTPALVRGIDDGKDQTYALFGIERRALERMLLPIGDYRKDQIRELARDAGLRVADKPDSQEICFVPDNDYAAFVRRRVGDLKSDGEIVTTDGEVVGRHDGIEHYTIGQRRGLGIAFGEPRYVVKIEADSRRVVVGTAEELKREELTADRANWLVDPPTGPIECEVKIRYLSKPAPATVTALAGGRLHVRMHEPRSGVAPGQACVCYDGDRVLGGGWIE
jgi:tRNA-specific 2-thiouridylase